MSHYSTLPPSLRVGAYFKHLTDKVLGEVASTWPDLTTNQVRMLIVVSEPVSMKELAKKLSITPSNLTPLVGSCVKSGWAQKIRSETDGRSTAVQLTPEGEGLRRELVPQIANIVQDTSGLSEDVFSQILKLIEDVETWEGESLSKDL